MNEIIIEGNQESKEYFEKFVESNSYAFIEESSGHDGLKIVSLIVENIPEILGAITALITILKAKNLSIKITKNGKEVSNLDE